MKARGIPYMVIVLFLPIFLAYGENPMFEVASIRPAPLNLRQFVDTRCHGGPGTENPGRWTCSNIPLSNLVISIFDLKGFQIGAASSVPQVWFTIAAKVPEGTTREQFKQMQLNLLIERCGLKYHREQKEMQGYELVVAKDGPKFKKSAPESPKGLDTGYNRTVFVGLAAGALSKGVWNRITMEDFAATLSSPGLAGIIPVIDCTGLKGIYDISLEWAPDIGNAVPIATAGGIPTASEPSGGSNMFSALQEQLGLKLERKKVTVDITVIDHIEESPTEN